MALHPTDMTEALTHPPRWLKWVAGFARWAFGVVLAFWLLLALAAAGLHWWIVPRIDSFRPLLERQAARVLGAPVRIERLSARSEGVFPTVELSGVRLLNHEGADVLELPRVVLTVSPRSVLHLGMEQLYVEAPVLRARRDASGHIFIAGLPMDHASGDASASDWLLSQTEIVVRRGTLHWLDAARAAPPLTLTDVDLVLRGGAWSHALRLDATPPPDWGERISLRARLREPLWNPLASAWEGWSGQWYVELPRIDLARLTPYLDWQAAREASGAAALRAWVDMTRGQAADVTADVALAGAQVRWGSTLEPLALDQLSARLGARRLPDGVEFSARQLHLRTDDDLAWDSGVLLLRRQGEGVAQRSELQADALDLAPLARIAARMPLADGARRLLQTYAPEGRVEQLQLSWQGPIDALSRYQAKGRVEALALAEGASEQRGAARAFGLRGARADFEFTEAGGDAVLAIDDGALRLPGVFEDARVPVQTLSATVRWQIDGARVAVHSDDLRFANTDAEGSARLDWRTGDTPDARLPGVLDLAGSLTRADGTRVHRYLPLAVGDQARRYVRGAITAGTSNDVQFRVKGDLRHLPFAGGEPGEFHIAAQIRNATLAYVPPSLLGPDDRPWPALTGLSGALVFDRASMRVEGAAGHVSDHPGLRVTGVNASIAALDKPVVQVTGDVHGPLAEMLGFVRDSQVSRLTGGALEGMSATGDASLRLQLQLPIATLARSRVDGSVLLAGNTVRVTRATPVLTHAQGTVGFSEQGFELQQVSARALGGEVRLAGGLQTPKGATDPVLQVRAEGVASGEGLRAEVADAGPLAELARHADGSSAYALVLGLRGGVPELEVTTDLRGMALQLPAPLGKPAEQPLPVRLETRLASGERGPGDGGEQRLTLTAGDVLALSYLRGAASAGSRVLAGRIAVGADAVRAAAPELTASAGGVHASVVLDALDLGAWSALLAASQEDGASAPPSPYAPTRINARVGALTFKGRTLHDVIATATARDGGWRADVAARELEGAVDYRAGDAALPQGSVHARLSRLSLARSDDTQVDTLLDDAGPSELPALDIEVGDFELRGKHLGRLTLQAHNRVAGEGLREWRLARLDLQLPEASFSSNGDWALLGGAGEGARRRTTLRFKLAVRDSGALLARMGMPGVLRKGEGELAGEIGWMGSPLTLDYPSLSGQMRLDMAAGQFLKADPGLSKLLGVLSLQALPRRLTLDFRDVFTSGFAFDFVRADVQVDKGIASTNNLQMKGVNAAVLMEGSADIAHETQNLHVVVVPELNTLGASVVATMINPLVGLGSFLAQFVLGDKLVEAATKEFRVEGTWSDPQVIAVEHKPAPAAHGKENEP